MKILKYTVFAALVMSSFSACHEGASDLLEPKVFFEAFKTNVEVGDEAELELDLQARLSDFVGENVGVTYSIADSSVGAAFNKKYGKEYLPFKGATLESEVATIEAGMLKAGEVKLSLTGLDEAQAGQTYLLPVRVGCESVPVIEGQDMTYFIINKPVKITRVAQFNSDYIKVPLTVDNVFKSVTYEALIYIDRFGDNNTIMGCEGSLILRIGDAGGGTFPRDQIQIAGKTEINGSTKFNTGKWYHVAFSCDGSSGKAAIYINGEVEAEGTVNNMPSDLRDFFIGKVYGFMWGERPFYGKMAEVRLWTVARTANQIRENMLSVDPKSEGLLAYYKLNGELVDASPNGMTPTETSLSAADYVVLDTPVAVK